MSSDNHEPGYFVRTKNPSHQFRLVWTVENVLHYPVKVGSFLKSPNFLSISEDNHGVEFYMTLYPFGDKEEKKDFISLFLLLKELPACITDVRAKFDISLLNKNQVKVRTLTCSDIMTKGWGWSEFMKREELENKRNEYLPGGQITIECFVEAYYHFKVANESMTIQSKSRKRTQSDSEALILKMLYEEEICTDIKLKASDGTVLNAHKCILSARSTYFKAMFEHRMKVNEEGLVDLSKDMDGEELEYLLEYIYLGTPPANLKESARKMFQIADMKGIPGLCHLSEETLIGQLDDSNAIELLIFANRNRAKKLKKAAAKQIANSDD